MHIPFMIINYTEDEIFILIKPLWVIVHVSYFGINYEYRKFIHQKINLHICIFELFYICAVVSTIFNFKINTNIYQNTQFNTLCKIQYNLEHICLPFLCDAYNIPPIFSYCLLYFIN